MPKVMIEVNIPVGGDGGFCDDGHEECRFVDKTARDGMDICVLFGTALGRRRGAALRCQQCLSAATVYEQSQERRRGVLEAARAERAARDETKPVARLVGADTDEHGHARTGTD